MVRISHVVVMAMIISVCICPPGQATASDKCITHPGQTNTACLPKQVKCDTKNCSWCQLDVCMECLPGFFMDFKDQSCKSCTPGCSVCTGPEANKCSASGIGHYLLPTGEVNPCGIEGCASCSPKPGKKMGQVSSKKMMCQACDQGYFNKQSAAKSSIPTLECKKCADENCLECPERTKECHKCKPGFDLVDDKCEVSKDNKDCKLTDPEGKCIDCPKGKAWSRKSKGCVECPENCLSCKEPNQCSEGCKPGHYFDKKEKACPVCKVSGCRSCSDDPEICDSCLNGKYFDVVKKKCMACHSSCSACTGPNETDCLGCIPGKYHQVITYVGAPGKLVKEEAKKMKDLIGSSGKVDAFMQVNFHPFEDRSCVDACVDFKTIDKKKFQGMMPPFSPAHCPAITLLHDQAKKGGRGRYGDPYDGYGGPDL